jgi:uncharacterized LabA/DUF88 family protein
VKEHLINWKGLSWCERVKVCAEARQVIQQYTRQMRIAKANQKVEIRARTMQHDRRHRTKFLLLLKELCEGNKEAFAIFMQARIRAYLIRSRARRQKAKLYGDEVSLLSSGSNFEMESMNDETKLISDNAYQEITYMTTDEKLITVEDAVNVLTSY